MAGVNWATDDKRSLVTDRLWGRWEFAPPNLSPRCGNADLESALRRLDLVNSIGRHPMAGASMHSEYG